MGRQTSDASVDEVVRSWLLGLPPRDIRNVSRISSLSVCMRMSSE